MTPSRARSRPISKQPCNICNGDNTTTLIDDEGVVRFRTSGGGLREPVGLEDAIKKLLKAAANRNVAALPGRLGG
jgi:hypothetical protein